MLLCTCPARSSSSEDEEEMLLQGALEEDSELGAAEEEGASEGGAVPAPGNKSRWRKDEVCRTVPLPTAFRIEAAFSSLTALSSPF